MTFYYIRPDMSHNSLKISSLSLKLIKLHIFKIFVFICILECDIYCVRYHVYTIDACNKSIMLEKVFFICDVLLSKG